MCQKMKKGAENSQRQARNQSAALIILNSHRVQITFSLDFGKLYISVLPGASIIIFD